MRATTFEEYRSFKAELGLVWLMYAFGSLAVVALVAHPPLVWAVLAAGAVALAAYRLPECLLAIFSLLANRTHGFGQSCFRSFPQ